jgi:hypothetical protein
MDFEGLSEKKEGAVFIIGPNLPNPKQTEEEEEQLAGGRVRTYLAVGGAVGLDGPACLVAERPEHLIVVAVPGQLVVPEVAQPGEDLRRDRPPAALPDPVVLPLPPRRHPPRASAVGPTPSRSLSSSVHLPLLLYFPHHSGFESW